MAMRVGSRYMTAEQRFDLRVARTESCWLWIGPLSGRPTDGRPGRSGKFRVNGRTVYAHRWAYERWVGPIPDGLTVDHTCGRPSCVNPDHLRLLPIGDNIRAHWREQRTHCRAGHELTADNLVFRLGGTERHCRPCERARQRRYKQRKKVG